MVNPSFIDVISDLFAKGRLTRSKRDLMKANYECLVKNKTSVVANHPEAKWIASVNGKLFYDENLDSLEKKMQNEPNSKFAYTEQVEPKTTP